MAFTAPTALELEAVTLDATGTLIHSPRLYEIYAEVLTRHGSSISEEEVRHLFPVVWKELDCRVPSGADRFSIHEGGAGGFWRRFLTRLCELHGVEAPSPFAAAELFDRFAQPAAWRIYEEVEEILTVLGARGLALGVVSNWDERLPTLLDRLGLSRHFEVVIASEAVGIAKPHRRIFALALETLGVAPERALHIGDNELEDVEGARAAGMEAIRLDRTGSQGLPDLSPIPELLAS